MKFDNEKNQINRIENYNRPLTAIFQKCRNTVQNFMEKQDNTGPKILIQDKNLENITKFKCILFKTD